MPLGVASVRLIHEPESDHGHFGHVEESFGSGFHIHVCGSTRARLVFVHRDGIRKRMDETS